MQRKRGVFARIGIVLLNLPAPGLGLLRVGRWRMALLVYCAWLLLPAFIIFAPPAPFLLFALAVALGLAAFVASIWLSWGSSRALPSARPWYVRWYSISAVAGVALVSSAFCSNRDHFRYRSFYVPSESMAPTLEKNDRFFVYMRPPTQLHRGDLVLVSAENGLVHIKRIAAMSGDRIAMRSGTVVINGAAVPQKLVGNDLVSGEDGPTPARRLVEQFPGEAQSHEIYDMGPSAGDDMPEQIVQRGRIFLLGDNRDDSADSRFSRDMGGLEQVPVAGIEGWPLYFSWGSSRPIGTPLAQGF